MKRKSNYTAVYNNFPEPPETFDYVNHTVLGVLRTICKNTSYTMVSNQWNNQSSESNFAYFCRAAKKHFNIDITED